MQIACSFPLYQRHLLYSLRFWFFPLGVPLMAAFALAFGSICTVNFLATAVACCPCVACLCATSDVVMREKVIFMGACESREIDAAI